MPFNADSVPKLKKIILEGEYHMPKYVSEKCQFVIKGLLRHVPQNRLSIEQIKQTKFLQSRRFSEPLPSYRLRKQKINSDQLLNTCNLKASSTLQLVSTNDCCKYAKRPVSDGESYAQLKKQDDNCNYKLASLLAQPKQLQSSPQTAETTTNTLINDYKQQEIINTQTTSKGNLSPQSDSGHCDEDSCKSVENQTLDQLPQPINSTTKLNLHYYNDQQYYPSQAVNYQNNCNSLNNKKPEEDSGVFKSEHSPKISFKSIENLNLAPIGIDQDDLINQTTATTNLNSIKNYNNQQQQQIQPNSKEENRNEPIYATPMIITRRLSDNKLSADEQETLRKLKELGITEQMLEENVDSGVKNSLIGIYRLVLHNAIANRLAKEKEEEEYREAKRKQKLESYQTATNCNQKVTVTQTYEDNRLRKSVSNGQFYEDQNDQTHQQSQLISSSNKSNRMHYSMDDGLEFCKATNDENVEELLDELDDDFLLNSNNFNEKSKDTNQMLNNLDRFDEDLKYSSSEEDCSILLSGEEDNQKYLDELNSLGDKVTGNRMNEETGDQQQYCRQFNEETIYNQQFLISSSSKKRLPIKRKELNELNKQNMINDHLNGVDDKIENEDYHTKCIDSYFVHRTASNSMIINTANLDSGGANLNCKLKTTNQMNEISSKPDHQPFKPYLNNYLEEEKRWKKHQKKKKKLKKRSVISCCIF